MSNPKKGSSIMGDYNSRMIKTTMLSTPSQVTIMRSKDEQQWESLANITMSSQNNQSTSIKKHNTNHQATPFLMR